MKTAEYRLVVLRETAPPDTLVEGDAPDKVAAYWRAQVVQSPAYNPDVENMAAIWLNCRRRILGHTYVATGTGDSLLCDPSSIFRGAIIAGARGIVLGHNHPSGDPTPSEADIKVTRDLMRGGTLLKVEVVDHIVIGHPNYGQGYASLRELGYLYT